MRACIEAGEPVGKDCGNPSSHAGEATALRVGRNGQVTGFEGKPA